MPQRPWAARATELSARFDWRRQLGLTHLGEIWLGVIILATANLLWWSFRSGEGWRALKRYSFRTRFEITSPFRSRWRQQIAAEDLPVLELFRNRFIRNYYLLWLAPQLGIGLLLMALNYVEYLGAKADLEESQIRLERLRQDVEPSSE